VKERMMEISGIKNKQKAINMKEKESTAKKPIHYPT